MVRSGGNKTPVHTTPTSPTLNNTPTTSNVALNMDEPIPPIPPTPSPSLLTGLGHAPFGDMGMPNMDPEAMRQMMDSPFMQNIMGNTGLKIMFNFMILFILIYIYLYGLDRFCAFNYYE